MENEFNDRKTRNYTLMRSIMDYGMGMIIVCVGIFLLVAPKWGFAFTIDDTMRYAFAVLCFIYGAWRIYRGYQKKYFRND